MEYVNNLKKCKLEKESWVEQKKKLDDMNGVLRRYKSKEEQYFAVQ